MMDSKIGLAERRRQFAAAVGGLVACLLLGSLSACSPGPAPAPGDAPPDADVAPGGERGAPPSVPRPILLGIDVLLRDSLELVRGRRVGLITNHTGMSAFYGAPREAGSTIDALAEHPDVDLVALYSPEHGIHGRAEAGEEVASGRDPRTGLPIHSLYTSSRKPTPEMLAGVDLLLFDIQDVGARYYTYVWTMALAMQAAGETGLPFVVLDRPNPIGGRLVQGNVLDPSFATFVGLYPVPMRHGLTAGELARLLVGEHGIEVELHVVPMQGWRRASWYDDTGLPFIPPSPNMPSLESATHYPGTCLFEGTNLSVGRGTERAFQQLGAPWLDAGRIVERLDRLVSDGVLTGVRFEPVTFTPAAPGDGKFGGETVRGIRLVATDRERYDPTRAAVALLIEVLRLHGDRLTWNVAHFDRLAGTDRLRQSIAAGAGLEVATAPWAAQLDRFRTLREPYLLYR